MALTVASGTTISIAANTKTTVTVSPQYEFLSRGKLTLANKASATGLNVTLAIGGVALCNDLPIAYFGATGGMSINDNVQVSQMVNGGRVELSFRNTTAGALTVDYMLLHDPGK